MRMKKRSPTGLIDLYEVNFLVIVEIEAKRSDGLEVVTTVLHLFLLIGFMNVEKELL